MLLDIFGQLCIQKAVIFANSKEKVDFLESEFQEADFDVSAIHEGLNQAEIQRVLHEFQCGNSRVLEATDFIAKFLDIPSITLVVNFEMPLSIDHYLHHIRISGMTGFVINICTEEEKQIIQQIKTPYHASLDELPAYFDEIVEQGFNR